MRSEGTKRLRWPARLPAAVLALTLLAGCGGQGTAPAKPAAPAAAQPARPASPTAPAGKPAASHKVSLVPVSLLFAYLPEGYEAPYALALEKGWYKAAGLKVKLVPGRGSATTLQLVGAGKATFGEVDMSVMPGFVGKGEKVKATAVFIQKTPLAIGSLVAEGITKPSDLAGKSIGVVPGGIDSQVLPAFLKAVHLTTKQVKVIDVSPQTKVSSLIERKVDAIVPFVNGTGVAIEKKAGKLNYLPLGDYGLDLLSIGLIARDSTIAKHPAWVRGFVQASQRGWVYAQQHPRQAVAALVKVFPNAKASIELPQLEASFPLLHSAATKGKPVGWQAKVDWQRTIDLMHEYAQVSKVYAPSHYYTNRFIGS